MPLTAIKCIPDSLLSLCSFFLQKRVDKEFFLLFSVMDEKLSWYIDENIEKYGSNETNVEDEDFVESNLMHGKERVPEPHFVFN